MLNCRLHAARPAFRRIQHIPARRGGVGQNGLRVGNIAGRVLLGATACSAVAAGVVGACTAAVSVGGAAGAAGAGRALVAVGNGSATEVAPKVATICAGAVGDGSILVTACVPPQLLNNTRPSTRTITTGSILRCIQFGSLIS